MAKAFISLGCNIGDCRASLARAVARLGEEPGTAVTGVSSVYITEPVGNKDQPDFMNIAVAIETGMDPGELLEACSAIEEDLGGRDGRAPMGPRAIDLDILLYEQVQIAQDDLKIPHPRMLERAFVLVPLAEIAPRQPLPDGRTVVQALAQLEDTAAVRKDGQLK